MGKIRAFIAIDIKTFPKLTQLEQELKQTKANIKLVEPENIHITLKFLGDTDENLIEEINTIIEESVKKTKPFEIQLKNTGVFPNQNYIKVIWIGIHNSEKIAEISQQIDEQLFDLGFEQEKRPFSPHLTIARVKSAENKDQLLNIINKYQDLTFQEIKVESIKLKKSQLTPKGPIYTTLKEIKLSKE